MWYFKSFLQSEETFSCDVILCGFLKLFFLTTEVGRPCRESECIPSVRSVCFLSLALENSSMFFRHHAGFSGACYCIVWVFLGWRPWPASCHPWSDKLLDSRSCQSSPHQIMDYFHVSSSLFSAEYTVINENCPGAEWNIMCRECCEYDQIECICPGQKQRVGYTIPCCRNEENECDSCLIHPGMLVPVLCSH